MGLIKKQGCFSTMLCALETRDPGVLHTSLVPTMAALFLDENLPDGTRLEPGTKFIKYWKMRNSGTISWTSETKLKFMWGNLGLASEEKREVAVPLLQPGQVGVVSVAFVAPVMEGTYTSHWRLAHCGAQFGPRVWCSILVDPGSRDAFGHQSKRLKEEMRPTEKEERKRSRDNMLSVDLTHRDYYFPSVDLLTAQDLLSFELLDINIVQELEKVPNNTPVDLTPCMSPLPHDALVLEKADPPLIKENTEVKGVRNLFGVNVEPQHEAQVEAMSHEEGDEEISGAQFLCETVIRSLTLEEAPDHKPPGRAQHSGRTTRVFPAVSRGPALFFERVLEVEKAARLPGAEAEPGAVKLESVAPPPPYLHLHQLQHLPQQKEDNTPVLLVVPEVENLQVNDHLMEEGEATASAEKGVKSDNKEGDKDDGDGEKEEDWDEVSSQASSLSSCDDYIIVLPDCFDTSRPLGESMYSSALSQPGAAGAAREEEDEEEMEEEEKEEPCSEDLDDPEGLMEAVVLPPPPVQPVHSSVNQMLCASQTLDAITLTPEVVSPPLPCEPILPPPALYSPRSEALYLAEDPSPPMCGPYEPRQPAVHLNISSGLSRSAGSASSAFETYNPRPCNALQPRGQGGITEGLVKGALSVAASAYKALFTGPNCSVQRGVDPAAALVAAPAKQDPSMMTVLLEMGFRDQRLNQRLLRKHGYSLLHTVNELVQMAEENQNLVADAHH